MQPRPRPRWCIACAVWLLPDALLLICRHCHTRIHLRPGTVLPAGASAYVSPSPRGFRARAASPKGGEGLLVLCAPRGWFDAAAAASAPWVLRDAGGAEISQA